jgi:hypothetical protein
MANAFSLLDLMVASLLSAVCQILWNLLVSNHVVSGAPVQVSDLKERQARAWDTVRAIDEPPMALVTSSVERLTHLIEKAEPILQARLPTEPSEPFHSPQPVSDEGALLGFT